MNFSHRGHGARTVRRHFDPDPVGREISTRCSRRLLTKNSANSLTFLGRGNVSAKKGVFIPLLRNDGVSRFDKTVRRHFDPDAVGRETST